VELVGERLKGLSGCPVGVAPCVGFMGREGRFAGTCGPHSSFFLSQALTIIRFDAKEYERHPIDPGQRPRPCHNSPLFVSVSKGHTSPSPAH
jgi:hypothetical protein